MAYDVETMINRHIVPSLGARLLSDLTMEDIGLFTGVLRQSAGIHGRAMGAERINKILKILKRSLQSAVESDVLAHSPMRGWLPLRSPKPEMRPFTRGEFRRLLAALPAQWRPYFEFAVWTGLRPGEQAALQWSDVDLEGNPAVVDVRATLDLRKSGIRRPPKTRDSADSVKLIPQAVSALQAQFIQRGSDQWVFSGPNGGPLNISNLTRRVYYPAIRRGEVVHRSLYNLRHTFAVFMLEAGENPGWVARQMRHTSAEMLWRRYARWWPQMAESGVSGVNYFFLQRQLKLLFAPAS
jgi:integrase